MSLSERQWGSRSRPWEWAKRQWLGARRKCGSPGLPRAFAGGNGHPRAPDGNRRGANAERRASDPQTEAPMDIGAAPMDIAETPMALAEPPMRFSEARNTSHEVATACGPGRWPGVEAASRRIFWQAVTTSGRSKSF